ncbi:MAG: tetratricopeptide repeat protein [Planctomycetota bacterium]|jgi:tetratricopeptide (TPR) repeat protein
MRSRRLLGIAALLLCTKLVYAEESAWTLLDKGLKEYRKGQLTRAEKLFDAAVRLDARCEDAYYYLGLINEKKRMPRQAEAFYKKISKKYPTYSLAAERMGQMALQQGDKKQALEQFQIFAKERPSGRAHMQVASVQLDLKAYKEAEASLAEAKKFFHDDLDLVEMYGRLYMETERYAEALDAYKTIIKKIPVDNMARYMCATCLQRLTREEEAVREFQAVLERDPYHAMTLRTLIRLYEGDPSKRSEVAEYRKRLKLLAKSKPKVRRVSGKTKRD